MLLNPLSIYLMPAAEIAKLKQSIKSLRRQVKKEASLKEQIAAKRSVLSGR